MTGLETVTENLRLQQLYSTAIHFAAESFVDRSLLGTPRRRLQRWIYRLDEVPPALPTPVRTRLMLEGLGPTFVKLGQIVSSQASNLPDDWRRELDRLQNEVPRSRTRSLVRSSRPSWALRPRRSSPTSLRTRSPPPRWHRCTGPLCTTGGRWP